MPDAPEDDSTYGFAPKEPAPPPAEEPLPEIAAPVASPQTAEAPAAARQEPVTEPPVERICPHCGFSYFGKPKARCPDCAAPAESALDLLQFSKAGWVRSVALGLFLTALAMVGHIAGSALWWAPDGHFRLQNDTQLVSKAVQTHAVTAVLLVIAVLLATRTEKGSVQDTGMARWLARLSALGAVVPWAMLLNLSMKHIDPGTVRGTIKTLVVSEMALLALLAVVMGFYTTSLAIRIPSDTLSFQSKTSGWMTGVVCLMLLGIQAFDMTEHNYVMFFMCSFPLVAGFLVILIWGILTLTRVGMDMRAAAHAGEMITTRRLERQAAKAAKTAEAARTAEAAKAAKVEKSAKSTKPTKKT